MNPPPSKIAAIVDSKKFTDVEKQLLAKQDATEQVRLQVAVSAKNTRWLSPLDSTLEPPQCARPVGIGSGMGLTPLNLEVTKRFHG